MERREALDLIATLTQRQQGLVTVAQVDKLGIPRDELLRLMAEGDVDWFHKPEVLRFRRDFRPQHQKLYAIWLTLDPACTARERWDLEPVPDAVVSHHWAAILWDLLPYTGAPGPTFTVAKPPAHNPFNARIVEAMLTPDEVTFSSPQYLPVTTATRTLADLVCDHTEVYEIGLMALKIVRLGLTIEEDVAETLEPFRGWWGSKNATNMYDWLVQHIEDLEDW